MPRGAKKLVDFGNQCVKLVSDLKTTGIKTMLHITDLRYTKNTEAGEQAGTFVINAITGTSHGKLQSISLKCEFTRIKNQHTTVNWGQAGTAQWWNGEDLLHSSAALSPDFYDIDVVNAFFAMEDKKW